MDNKIKLGLVGLNFGGYFAEKDIFNGHGGEYIQVTAACDLDLSKAEEYGKQHNLKVYAGLADLLADKDIDAIGLFTPPAGRAELIRKCIRAGKHVITTKPFELDPDEALTVLYEAREAGIIVHINSPAPLPSMDIAKIKEWKERYDLGQPISARWETYARYHECADGSWMDSQEKCPVAPIFRLGIYGINELIAIIGEVNSVQVSKSSIFTERPTPDNAELTMQFANGAIGSIFASFCIGNGTPYPAELTIHFENGTITKQQNRDGSEWRNTDFSSVGMKLKCINDGKFIEEYFEFPPEYRSGAYQWDNFYKAIRHGKKTDAEISPETVAAGISTILAMAKAEKSGKLESIPNYQHIKYAN